MTSPPSKTDRPDLRPRRYSSEDIHRTLFSQKPPQKRTLEELKDGIADYVRAKHPRR